MQRVADEPTLAAAALRYANLGIPVFPCVPGGKQPLTPNGFHDATSVARVVHRWWQRTPDANIGLPTGAHRRPRRRRRRPLRSERIRRLRASPLRRARRRLGLDGPHALRRDPRLLPDAAARSSAPGRSRRRTSTSEATAATSSLPRRASRSTAHADVRRHRRHDPGREADRRDQASPVPGAAAAGAGCSRRPASRRRMPP